MAEQLISLKELCERWGVDHVAVYEWISTKKLPAQLIDGRWQFDSAEVEAWAKETDVLGDKAGSG